MAYFVDDEDMKFPSLLTQDQKAQLESRMTPQGDENPRKGTSMLHGGSASLGRGEYLAYGETPEGQMTGLVTNVPQSRFGLQSGDGSGGGLGLNGGQAPMSSMAGYRDMRVKDDMQAKYDAMRARSDEFLRGPMGAQTLGELGIRTNEDIAGREQGLRGIETARTEKANREAKEQALFDRELARIEAAGGIKKDVAATTQQAMTERERMKQELAGRKLNATTVENELDRKSRIDEIMARGGVERENDLAGIDQEYVNESKLLREKGDIEGARQVDRLRVDSASDMLKAAANSYNPKAIEEAMTRLQETVSGLGGTAAAPAQPEGEAAEDIDGDGQPDTKEQIQFAQRFISGWGSREAFLKAHPDKAASWDKAEALIKAYRRKIQADANATVGV